MIAATDFLARSFTWKLPGAGTARGLGLAALQALGPVKSALARQLGPKGLGEQRLVAPLLVSTEGLAAQQWDGQREQHGELRSHGSTARGFNAARTSSASPTPT